MKPVKRGIKVWVLADVNGYFCNMQVYTGRESSAKRGLSSRVVSSTSSIMCTATISLQLLEYLEEVGLYACGTARSNRTGFPSGPKKMKLDNRYIG